MDGRGRGHGTLSFTVRLETSLMLSRCNVGREEVSAGNFGFKDRSSKTMAVYPFSSRLGDNFDNATVGFNLEGGREDPEAACCELVISFDVVAADFMFCLLEEVGTDWMGSTASVAG